MDNLQAQINKRLTLNVLIQGSAQHAFLTCHHLVREELNRIDGNLVSLYDKFAVAAFINYWYGISVLICGRPARFWRRIADPDHPFVDHPILVRHGAMLAAAAKDRAVERCRAKGVTRVPVLYSLQISRLVNEVLRREGPHKARLERLAKQVTEMIWGISQDRLDAELTKQVAFGNPCMPASFHGQILRATAVGYGGVLRRSSQLRVAGKAWVWPLLCHELVKGTAELVCMHGLNELDEQTYRQVVSAADRIEFEPWMLQAGAELWRRLLPLLPDSRPLPETMMQIARLPPHALEHLIMAVLENPTWASELLAGLEATQEEQTPVGDGL